MNNARRKQLIRLSSELRELAVKISDIREQIDDLRDGEQEAYDNMPESIQNGDKGQMAIEFRQARRRAGAGEELRMGDVVRLDENGDLVRAIDPEFIPVAYAMNRMRLAGLDVRLARDKVSVRAQGLAASLFVHPGNLVDGRKVDRMIRFARRADDMIAADLS